RDTAGNRAALEPEAADETDPNTIGIVVALDHHHLENVAIRIRNDETVANQRIEHKMIRDELIRPQADDTNLAVARRDVRARMLVRELGGVEQGLRDVNRR